MTKPNPITAKAKAKKPAGVNPITVKAKSKSSLISARKSSASTSASTPRRSTGSRASGNPIASALAKKTRAGTSKASRSSSSRRATTARASTPRRSKTSSAVNVNVKPGQTVLARWSIAGYSRPFSFRGVVIANDGWLRMRDNNGVNFYYPFYMLDSLEVADD